jgi:hypothetical protein
MNTRTKTFGSPSGEPSTTRPTNQQMCEKLWTLPATTGCDVDSLSEPGTKTRSGQISSRKMADRMDKNAT